MTQLATIKIVWAGDPGYLTINEGDFDESIHTLWANDEPAAIPAKEKRQAELAGAPWQTLKTLAARLDPPILEKPDEGWDSVIPLILEAEYAEAS